MKFEDLAFSSSFAFILIVIGIFWISQGPAISGGGIDMTNHILGLIFLAIGITILVISIILVIGKLLIREAKTPTPVHTEDVPTLEILKQRLVKGEISIEEFNKIKETLEKKV